MRAPAPPKSEKERQKRLKASTKETPQQAKRRTDLTAELPYRDQAAPSIEMVDMTECWKAVGPDTGGTVTLTQFAWCSVGLFEVEDVRCENDVCKTVGSITFRASV